jgi:hypothetical protein
VGTGSGTIDGAAHPWECRYGAAIIRTRVRGFEFGGGGLNWGYLDTIIESLTPVQSWKISSGINTDWNAYVETYRIRYKSKYGNDIQQIVSSSTDPPFGANGQFRVEPIDWRCILRDGTQGPLRTPADQIVLTEGGDWLYPPL